MKNSKLALAIAITAEAFKDRFDKGGNPYILHCLYVMDGVKHLDDDSKCVAVMHDLVEDCKDRGYDFNFLTNKGFSEKTIRLLYLLTHNKETPYMEYIKCISVDKDATEIKKRDLEHNSNITRLKGLTKKDHDRLEKYCIAYTYLKEI